MISVNKPIAMLAVDTRGNVQPLVALAKGLQAAGAPVRMITHQKFAPLVARHGLEFASLPDMPAHSYDKVEQYSSVRTRAKILGQLTLNFVRKQQTRQQHSEEMKQYREQLIAQAFEACEGCRGVVYGLTSLWGGMVAEAHGVPGVCAGLFPVSPTAEFPHVLFRYLLGRNFASHASYNRWTYRVVDRLFWRFIKNMTGPYREKFGLPSLPKRLEEYLPFVQTPRIYGISPSVLPRPANWPDSDRLVGYWFLDEDQQWDEPEELSQFLAEGPPPVCIGFGSMPAKSREAFTRKVLSALWKTGQRGLLLTGEGGLQTSELPPTVMALADAPHDALFPRVSAVVHHGGAGTTAAVLRAGIPNIIIPWMGDQFFWSDRVVELNCGPRAPSKAKLSETRLTEILQTIVKDESIRKSAGEVEKRLALEDGVGLGAQLILEYLETGRLPPRED